MPDSLTVKLKVLSPIHIGSGETLTRLDYYFDRESRFCRVNLDGLFADPDFASQRDEFLEAAPGGQRIDELVPVGLLQRHHHYRLRVSRSALEYGKTRALEVKTCIKSAGRVYVPGSSIKGAILSALCWRILLDGWNSDKPGAKDDIGDLLTRGRTQDQEGLLDVVLARLGGRGTRAFTHWLDVTDSDLKAPADCLGVSLVDVKNPSLTSATARKDLRLLCETVQAKTEFTFTLKLDGASNLIPDALLAAVREFYRKVAEADKLKESDKLDLPGSDCLIRLGGGSGRYATSLLVLARETGLNWGPDGYERRVKPPKSRKRAGNADCPLGWAQMTLEHQ